VGIIFIFDMNSKPMLKIVRNNEKADKTSIIV